MGTLSQLSLNVLGNGLKNRQVAEELWTAINSNTTYKEFLQQLFQVDENGLKIIVGGFCNLVLASNKNEFNCDYQAQDFILNKSQVDEAAYDYDESMDEHTWHGINDNYLKYDGTSLISVGGTNGADGAIVAQSGVSSAEMFTGKNLLGVTTFEGNNAGNNAFFALSHGTAGRRFSVSTSSGDVQIFSKLFSIVQGNRQRLEFNGARTWFYGDNGSDDINMLAIDGGNGRINVNQDSDDVDFNINGTSLLLLSTNAALNSISMNTTSNVQDFTSFFNVTSNGDDYFYIDSSLIDFNFAGEPVDISMYGSQGQFFGWDDSLQELSIDADELVLNGTIETNGTILDLLDTSTTETIDITNRDIIEQQVAGITTSISGTLVRGRCLTFNNNSSGTTFVNIALNGQPAPQALAPNDGLSVYWNGTEWRYK